MNKRKCRANGEGNLVKKGSYWLARWTFHGKGYSRSTKCTERREAEKVLKEFMKPFQTSSEQEALTFIKAKLEDSAAKNEVKDPPTKLAFMLDIYLSDISVSKISDGSYTLYQTVLESIAKFFPEKTYVHELSGEDVENYLKARKEKLSPSSYNVNLTIIKKVFDVLVKNDNNIEKNFFREYKRLKEPKTTYRREITNEEFDRLVEASSDNIQLRGMFILGWYTGMRESDCATLRWSEVNFETLLVKKLPKKTKKNGKYAVVPMHTKLTSALLEIKEMKLDDEFVLPDMAEMYMTKKANVEVLLRKVFTKAGITTTVKDDGGKNHSAVSFHCLRHSFISRCMRAGIPVNQIQTMVSHSSAEMSLHYTHTNDVDLHLPDFDDTRISVKVDRELYDKLMTIDSDFNAALRSIMKGESK